MSQLKARRGHFVTNGFFGELHINIVDENSAIRISYGNKRDRNCYTGNCAMYCLTVVNLIVNLTCAHICQAYDLVAGWDDIGHDVCSVVAGFDLDDFDVWETAR